jgi:hypothetical protein
MPCTSTKKVLYLRAFPPGWHEDKLDSARVEDGVDIGFENPCRRLTVPPHLATRMSIITISSHLKKHSRE